MTITNEELAEWKRLADAATPGPWSRHVFRHGIRDMVGWEGEDGIVTRVAETYGICAEDDAAFIAASNPDTIKRLVARVEELEYNNRTYDEVRLDRDLQLDYVGELEAKLRDVRRDVMACFDDAGEDLVLISRGKAVARVFNKHGITEGEANG